MSNQLTDVPDKELLKQVQRALRYLNYKDPAVLEFGDRIRRYHGRDSLTYAQIAPLFGLRWPGSIQYWIHKARVDEYAHDTVLSSP